MQSPAERLEVDGGSNLLQVMQAVSSNLSRQQDHPSPVYSYYDTDCYYTVDAQLASPLGEVLRSSGLRSPRLVAGLHV